MNDIVLVVLLVASVAAPIAIFMAEGCPDEKEDHQ